MQQKGNLLRKWCPKTAAGVLRAGAARHARRSDGRPAPRIIQFASACNFALIHSSKISRVATHRGRKVTVIWSNGAKNPHFGPCPDSCWEILLSPPLHLKMGHLLQGSPRGSIL
jgi:hypothetical protein